MLTPQIFNSQKNLVQHAITTQQKWKGILTLLVLIYVGPKVREPYKYREYSFPLITTELAEKSHTTLNIHLVPRL